MIRLRLLIFFAYIFASLIVYGQEPYVVQLNEDHGLPSMETYDIASDKNGIIWIGCDLGLYKYNGVYFKKYSSKIKKDILY